jgi:molecular chaperone GrpE
VHEAVGVEPTEPEKAGMVLEEWQKGYKIGERLLRPSRVKVGKTEEKAGDDAR